MIVGLLAPAWALDATGSGPLPGEGAVTDPIVAMHPVAPAAGDASVGVTLELAANPMTLSVYDQGEVGQLDVVKGLFGATVLASAGLSRRVELGVSMPIWLGVDGVSPGTGLGDLRVQAPVAILRGGDGLGLSVVPWVDAPTGADERWLGRGGFGLGAMGVVGYGAGPVRGSLDLGAAFSAEKEEFGVDESRRLLGAAALSWAVTPGFGLTAEADVTQPLVSGATAGEARLGARGRLRSGMTFSGGLATAIAPGVGSARWRAYAGVGFHFGRKEKGTAVPQVVEAPRLDPDTLLVTATDEAGAPLLAEVHATAGEQVRDATTDGAGHASLDLGPGTWELVIEAPGREIQRRTLVIDDNRFRPAEVMAALAPIGPGDGRLALFLTDAAGTPIEDARVTVDGLPRGVTGPGGTLTLEGVASGGRLVALEAPGFRAFSPVTIEASPGAAPHALVLERPVGAVKVRVHSPEGVVSDALVRFSGPDDIAPFQVGPTGEHDLTLGPGTWSVTVASARYGLQSRSVVIAPDETELVLVDVLLAAAEGGDGSLAVRVVDPDGHPVEGAEVRLDGVSVGHTATGGALALEGLTTGTRKLEVSGERFRASPPRTVELVAGARDLLVQLDWLPGTVEVVARGPDGPVRDALVRFSGPFSLAPAELGPDGRAFFSLAAGAWRLVLASQKFGLQSRELTVTPDQTSLVLVEAVMRAAEDGAAAFVVRVKDPDGAPVEGAQVSLDGLAVGTTATAGSIRLEGLQPGRRSVTVSADLYQDATLKSVALKPGENEATARLSWVPGTVELHAAGPDGVPEDALARFYGAEALPPVRLGSDGERTFALSPGPWTVVLASERYGVAQRDVQVMPGTTAAKLDMKFEATPTDEASLLVEVVDPDGAPVPGARVSIGEEHVFPSGAGVLSGLEPGRRAVRVEATGYTPLTEPRMTLLAGAQERRFVLQPIPREVRVTVRGPAGPVDANVRLQGPSRVAPITTGADGEAELRLRPGAWQVLASAEGFGVERADLVVPAGVEPLTLSIPLSASRLEVTAQAVLLRQQVRFAFNEATLLPESYPVLDELAATLRVDTGIGKIEVQGHTDAVGTEDYNVALSQRRADAVRDYLVAKGVPRERLLAKGYGTSRSQASNDTEAGRARNRRVQFEVVE